MIRWTSFGFGAVAEVAGIDRAGVGHRILPPERRRDRQPNPFGELGEIMRCAFAPSGAADDRDRGGGIPEQRRQRHHRLEARRLADARDRRAIDRRGGFGQHVLGQRQHHRPGPPARRGRPGARDIFGDAPRVLDPARPFGERGEHRGEIDFLERLAIARAAIDVADEQDHRHRILHRDMDADARVGRAGPARDEGDARPPGQRPVGAGHERRPALLPAGDEIDRGRVVERVEHGEEAFAGDVEDAVAALRGKVVDEDAAAGACVGHDACLAALRSAVMPERNRLESPFRFA